MAKLGYRGASHCHEYLADRQRLKKKRQLLKNEFVGIEVCSRQTQSLQGLFGNPEGI